jgi:hypothetical protein
MSILVSQFKDVLLSKSGGKPLSKVANFNSILWQTMTKVKRNVDLPSAMRTVQLTNPVFTDVRQYPLPVDMALNSIVNIRPITVDTTYYDFTNLNQRQFNIEEKFDPTSKRYGIRNINGRQYLLINDETTSPTTINQGDSLTDGGVTSAYGASSGIYIDTLQKISGAGAIGFSAGVGGTNGVVGTLTTPVDLSNQNNFLAYVYIPSLTYVNGIRFALGQGAINVYLGTTAVDFFGNALAVGWNLINIPKTAFAVGAGSPTWSNVSYWRIEPIGTFPTTVSGFRVDSFVGQIGALYEIDYYSDYQFQNSDGSFILQPSSDTDRIVISGDEIDLFTDQFIEIMTVDLKQQGVQVDYQQYGGNKLLAAYEQFKFKFPSQRQLMKTTYGSNPQGTING